MVVSVRFHTFIRHAQKLKVSLPIVTASDPIIAVEYQVSRCLQFSRAHCTYRDNNIIIEKQ